MKEIMKYEWSRHETLKRTKSNIILSMESMEDFYLRGIKQRDNIINNCEQDVKDIQQKLDEESEYAYRCSDYNYVKALVERCSTLEEKNSSLTDSLDDMHSGEEYKKMEFYIAKLEANIVKRELK